MDAVENRKILRSGTIIGVVGCVATIAGSLGDFHWILDLASHFPIQTSTLLLCAAIVCVRTKGPKRAGLFAILGLLNLGEYTPQLLGERGEMADGEEQFNVVLYNVETDNLEYEIANNYIQDVSADVVGLLEVNPLWLESLKGLHSRFPYRVEHARMDNFGIALFSRFPIENSEIKVFGNLGVPSIVADITIRKRKVHFIVTHAVPPMSADRFEARNAQLRELAKYASTQSGHVLLMGDLNTTPWSNSFKRLVAESGLIDTSQGTGFYPTWPAWSRFAGITVDHCLRSDRIAVVDRDVGDDLGSDHRPVLYELGFASKLEE